MSKHLLIIADDWEALEVYEDRLTPHFEVAAAPFGSEGIKMAREIEPDRILVDLTLEDMHASEACERLRSDEATRRVPITVVLNQGEKPFEREGVFPLPGDQVVQRPYEPQKLVELLR